MYYLLLLSKLKLKYVASFLALICLTISFTTSIASDITYNPADLESAWSSWKSNYVTTSGAGSSPRQRVLGGVSSASTVSEGQAYGLLLSSLFDEQPLFDGLWLFAADHLDSKGLMNWHIFSHGVVAGSGAATDGDVDMAIAMVTACNKVTAGIWSPSSNNLDYCQIANDLIDSIWQYEVDHPGSTPSGGLDNNQGYELLPGDSWSLKTEYPDGIVNLSYFSPAYFRVFADFTANSGWYSVIDRNYEIANLSQQIAGNCSFLIPNWSKYNGQYQHVPWQGGTSEYWGYDGARFAWRVATDSAWFGDPEAVETMNEIGGFFSSIGINDVHIEYRLNGSYVNGGRNPFFVSNAASAIWAAPSPIASGCGQATGTLRTSPQQAYEAVVNIPTENYYNDSWRLLTMVLMTGNFPNPQTIVDGVPPTATPSPIPDLPPSQLPVIDTLDTPANWIASNAWEHGGGSFSGNGWSINTFSNRNITSILERAQAIDLTTADNPQLRYQYQAVLSSADTLYIDISTDDGATWVVLAMENAISQENWQQKIIDLTPMVGQVVDVRYRMVSTGNIPSGESSLAFAFDNFEVSEEPATPQDTPTYTPTVAPTATPTEGSVVTSDTTVTAQIKQDAENNTQFNFQITNIGAQPVNDVSTRVYFDVDGNHSGNDYLLRVYYDSSKSVTVSDPLQWDADTYYFEINYNNQVLNAGNSFVYHGALHINNWDNVYDNNNDWWRTNLTSGYTVTNHIPVYTSDVLLVGQEPEGSAPPPTSTPTFTETPTTVVDDTTNTPTMTATNASTPTATIQPNQSSDLLMDGRVDIDNDTRGVFRYRINNQGSESVGNLSVRIFFDVDNSQAGSNYYVQSYFDQSRNSTLSGPFEWDNDTYYFEVNHGTYTLSAGRTVLWSGILRLSNWSSNFSSANDWWRIGLTSSYGQTSNFPLYVNGVLTVGQEPPKDGNTVPTNTPSHTPTIPTLTPTNTNTATVVPQNTATFTPTFTPTNTATATLLPTLTSTPLPTNTPLPTATTVPASNTVVTVQLRSEGTDNNQQSQFRYMLNNTGTSPVSGLAIRLYFDLDNGENASNYILENYYDSSSSAVVSGPHSWDSDTYYYEVSYNGTLNNGASFEYSGAFHLGNWASTFSSGNDWWRRTISSSNVVTTYIPVYVNGTLTFGQEPPTN